MMNEMKGVCFLFSETGTEGGWCAMQEDGFVTEDGHWKYEGLQYLEEGDDFTVYADDGCVLSGTPQWQTGKPPDVETASCRLHVGTLGPKEHGPRSLGRVVHREQAVPA
jgi:hypothetical protein